MPYTSLPPAPSRSNPATFAADADTFVAALDPFGRQMAAIETLLQPLASASAAIQAYANFRGTWVAQSYAVPSSVYYLGNFYNLFLAATSTDIPGVAATKWVKLPGATLA